MKYYKLTVLVTSIVVWTYIVRMYVVLFIVLSLVTLFIDKLILKRNPTFAVALNSSLFIGGFFLLKNIHQYGITLPIGYSVFAFSSISYMVDQKRRYVDYSVFELLDYLLFFPKAFAGPIERADSFITQLNKPSRVTSKELYIFFKLCIFASCCKYVLADTLYNIDPVDYKGLNTVFSVLTFAIAFYLDFYAYSIFAIAFGKLFGIQLSNSFNAPYRSKNLKEFWSRWNITLGRWICDYIYVPLGGCRKGTLNMCIYLMVAFLVSAIWHNTTYPFFLWGVVHALFLIVEKLSNIKQNIVYTTFVMMLVCFLWQCFRVDSLIDLIEILHHCCEWENIHIRVASLFAIAIIFITFADSQFTRRLIYTYPEQQSDIKYEVAVMSLMLTLTLLFPHSININFFYLRF